MIRLKVIGNVTYIKFITQKKSQLKLIQGDKLVDIYKALKEMNIKERVDVYFNRQYLGTWKGDLL